MKFIDEPPSVFSQRQNFDWSVLKSPGETDNKRRLSCRAFNKNIPGSTIEDHWDILVQCKYSVVTSLDNHNLCYIISFYFR